MTNAMVAVGQLYAGLLQPSLWSQGLTALSDALNADHIIGLSEGPSGADEGGLPLFWGGRLSNRNVSDFAAFGSSFREIKSRVSIGSAAPGEAIVSNPVLFSMPIYEKAIRPAGGHFSLAARPSRSGFLVACRSRSNGHFDGQDLDNFSAILPALRTAFELKRHLSLLERSVAIFQDTLDAIDGVGVFLLDKRGTILHLNQAAERLLEASNGIYYTDGGWAGLSGDDTSALRRLIAGNAESICPLRRRAAHRPLMARTVPIKPVEREGWSGIEAVRIALFVRDPDHADQNQLISITRALGLTKVEARLAVLLSEGNSLSAVADLLGITVGNSRIHLKRIFSKTDTHRQAELVRLLMSLKS